MLVLSRKISEGVVIDGRIRVTVLKIRGSRVQIGIEAQEDVAVRRLELEGSGGCGKLARCLGVPVADEQLRTPESQIAEIPEPARKEVQRTV
jgi:carbon storage regulator CsrA